MSRDPRGVHIEPLSGQFVLDFETAPLEQKVHALGQRTAEEWFEMGMAQDANPETLEAATEAYRQAIAAAPEWVEAYINLGTSLFQLGRWEESRDAFSRAAALDPTSALAHFNFGCVCDRLGEVEKSLAEFRASIELAPDMADAHLNLALGYEKTARKSEAARHFSLYLRHEPSGPWADFVRGKLQPARRATSGKVTPFRHARS